MSLENRIINNCTLIKQIDTGGMSEIWIAKNHIGVIVAIKILDKEYANIPSYLKRFQQEVDIMVMLNHKNIRKIYDLGEIDGRPAMIMEYLDGQNLENYLKQNGKLNTIELENYWNQCVEGLNYVHKNNIVHRDLKPSNIFLTSDGVIKIIDFGISKDVSSENNLTKTGAFMGTVWYMSPEQIKSSKNVTIKSDAYSLAVTFVHLASNKIPYGADKISSFLLQEKIVYELISLEKVPATWQLFLNKFLHKKKEDRATLIPFSNLTKKINNNEETIISSTKLDNENSKKKKYKLLAFELFLSGLLFLFAWCYDSYKDNENNKEDINSQKKMLDKEIENKELTNYSKEKEVFSKKMRESEAIQIPSGLKILMLKKTLGEKVDGNKLLYIDYSLYTANGIKIKSTKEEGSKPLIYKLNEKIEKMFFGFKEGVRKLNIGEKVRLFIPYYLGYGKVKHGKIPPKSDLIIDVEVIKMVNQY